MDRIYTQPFCVAGALLQRDGKVLLVKEAGGPDKGKWNHPCGWFDVGESPIDGAIREVREETGYAFTPTGILGVYSLVRNDLAKKLGHPIHPIKIIFTGRAEEAPSSRFTDEILEVGWIPFEEVALMDDQTLRDPDVKNMAKQLASGIMYPLEILHHYVRTA